VPAAPDRPAADLTAIELRPAAGTPLVLIDTLRLIERLVTPTGTFNVHNTQHDVY